MVLIEDTTGTCELDQVLRRNVLLQVSGPSHRFLVVGISLPMLPCLEWSYNHHRYTLLHWFWPLALLVWPTPSAELVISLLAPVVCLVPLPLSFSARKERSWLCNIWAVFLVWHESLLPFLSHIPALRWILLSASPRLLAVLSVGFTWCTRNCFQSSLILAN